MYQLFKNLNKNQRKSRFIFFLHVITGKKTGALRKNSYNVHKQCNDSYPLPVEILTGD